MASHSRSKPLCWLGIFAPLTVRLWLLTALFPAVLFAQTLDERREDDAQSADQEAALPDDSLYASGSGHDTIAALPFNRRVRFVQSMHYSRESSESFEWPGLWSRTRLTVLGNREFRADLLAIRRVDDPQTFDELHLTVSGRHAPTQLDYTLGTFELDWGLGVLSSASFGTARSLSNRSAFTQRPAQGVIARPVSREGSWLRGAAVHRTLSCFGVTVFGSDRPWNAEIDNGTATLTGVLTPVTATGLARRDELTERLFGAAVQANYRVLDAGLLAQSTAFSTPLAGVGESLAQISADCGVTTEGASARAEFARSRSETAWGATASGTSGIWRGLLYATHFAPDYIALRSQSTTSFGESARNESTLGVRGGVSFGRNLVTAEVRDTQTLSETATVAPSRAASEAELNWLCDVSQSFEVSFRVVGGSREENHSGAVVDRDFERARVIAHLEKELDWTARFDHVALRDRSGANPATGSYAHLQLADGAGRFRPGARVAFFTIPSDVGPLLIYEPSVAGAYPLRSVSGDGRILSAWLLAITGPFYSRFTVSHATDATESGSISAFGLELGFRQ